MEEKEAQRLFTEEFKRWNKASAKKRGCSIKLYGLIILVALFSTLVYISRPQYLKFNYPIGLDRAEREKFFIAIEQGDINEVGRILSEIEDEEKKKHLLGATGPHGDTPLNIAIKNGRLEVAGFLIDNGADVNKPGLNNWEYPLHSAVAANSFKSVEFLLDHGAKVNVYNKDFVSPLNLALKAKNQKLYDLMIPYLKNPNIFDDASLGRVDSIRQRIDSDRSSINEKASGSPYLHASPLFYAVAGGNLETVTLLLELGADPDSELQGAWIEQRPLQIAIKWDMKEIAEMLLESGASMENFDKMGNNPLHQAVANGSIGVVNVLIKHGADVNAKNRRNNDTPLHIAAEAGHQKVACLLIDKGASVDAVAGRGDTPLHRAIRKGHVDLALLLIGRGADIKRKNGSHETAFSLTGRIGNVRLANMLIRRPGVLRDDVTLLQPQKIDSESNFYMLVPRKGVHPFIDEANDMLTAAAKNGHVELVTFLLDKGFNANLTDDHRDTALQLAARKGNLEVCKILLDRGAKVDKGSYTPLQYAALEGHTEVARLLLERGADRCLENDNGETSLDMAEREGHKDTADLLKDYPCGAKKKRFIPPFDFDQVEMITVRKAGTKVEDGFDGRKPLPSRVLPENIPNQGKQMAYTWAKRPRDRIPPKVRPYEEPKTIKGAGKIKFISSKFPELCFGDTVSALVQIQDLDGNPLARQGVPIRFQAKESLVVKTDQYGRARVILSGNITPGNYGYITALIDGIPESIQRSWQYVPHVCKGTTRQRNPEQYLPVPLPEGFGPDPEAKRKTQEPFPPPVMVPLIK